MNQQDIEFYFSKGDKKRKANEISDNPYEDANSQLRELYYQRKKIKDEANTNMFSEPEEERYSFKIKSGSVKEERKDDSKEKVESNSLVQQKKTIHSENIKPILWINRLRYYPPNELLPNMVAFREILFEDLLKNNPKNPKRTLEFAFMTTFGYNLELLEPLVQTGVKLVLANEWSDPKEPRIERNLHGYSNFTLIRPPKDPTMNFRGAFHPKLWILKFPKFLRVVVATGNLTAGDWIIWSNGLWFQDFPLRSTLSQTPMNIEDTSEEFDFDRDFKKTLKFFLQSIMPMKIEYTKLLDFNLDDYHISNVDIVLIPSLPGRHREEDFDKYGHRRIAAVLKKLMPKSEEQKPKNRVLTYQSSSMGSINEKYVKEILSSLIPNYITLDQLKAEKKYKGGITPSGDALFKKLRIIYPSKDYVENCIEGPQYSGCLLLSAENYQKPTFPKQVFHQFQGADNYIYHEGIIAHIKIFVVTDESGEIDDDTYIYFGSHNLSPSAWGKYEKDYTQFTISHTELGVLVPPRKGSKARKQELIKNLPFKFPPQKYRRDQVPWIFDLHFDPQKE